MLAAGSSDEFERRWSQDTLYIRAIPMLLTEGSPKQRSFFFRGGRTVAPEITHILGRAPLVEQ